MSKRFNLQDGTVLTLATKPIGEGGEGEVFEIESPVGFSDFVAKILFNAKRTNERRYKARYMVDNPPVRTQDGNGHDFLIWPRHLLFDNTDFVGFIMPRAYGVDLSELCRVKLAPEFGAEWKKFDRTSEDSMILRLTLCSNIAKAVEALHSTNHYIIGDLKPENIRVKSNGLVSILDLDSCQISDGGQVRFQSKMNTPKYNPPDAVTADKHKSWDYFILGVIFYEILCGIHPFAGTTKYPYEHLNTPDLKIPEGLFPFGSKGSFYSVIALPHYKFKSLPSSVQDLFIVCFDKGIKSPGIRPNTIDWINILTAKPSIKKFSVDKTSIICGMDIILTWRVEGADNIIINEGIGSVDKTGSVTLTPNNDRVYVIKAENRFGFVEAEVAITSFPTPVLEALKVPMPDFASEVDLDMIRIQSPQINTAINISLFGAPSPKFPGTSEQTRKIRPEYLEKPEFLNLQSVYEAIIRKISSR
jgi:serine/threonine protein kinase